MKSFGICVALGLLLILGTGAAGAVETTIYNIQTEVHPLGTEVTVRNCIVTGSGFWGFYIQVMEADHHPGYLYQYSGIWVYTGNTHIGNIARGNVVDVTGLYEEYNGLSEIDINHSPCGATVNCGFEIVLSEGVEPAPVEVLMSDVKTTGPLAETYEGVLLRVDRDDSSLFACELDGFGQWYLRSDFAHNVGDSIMVDHHSADPGGEFDYAQPPEDTELTFVQGILNYDHDDFKLDPRNCYDDLGMACTPELRGAWAYDNTHIDVWFAIEVELSSAEDEANYTFDSGLAALSAERNDLDHRFVRVTTAPQEAGLIDIIYVESIVAEVGGGEMQEAAEFTFTQGITSLYKLQHVDDLLLDASLYEGVVVTTTGRISAIDGRYYFLQEGDAGPFQHIYSRASAVGDIAVGDSVKVAGDIEEYYGQTNLTWRSGVQLFENLGPATQPVITTDVAPADILYDAVPNDFNPPDDNAPEPWESALVRLNAPCYLDSVAGEGIYGEWWLLPGTGAGEPDTCRADFTDEWNDFGDMHGYSPSVGDSIILGGIFTYDFDYKIVPFTSSDIYWLSSDVDDRPITGPSAISLSPARPNPSRSATTFRYRLAQDAAAVSIGVYDVTGACVRHLIKGEAVKAGEHTVEWNGINDVGLPTGAGLYFYRMDVDGRTEARRMIRVN